MDALKWLVVDLMKQGLSSKASFFYGRLTYRRQLGFDKRCLIDIIKPYYRNIVGNAESPVFDSQYAPDGNDVTHCHYAGGALCEFQDF